MSVVNGGPLPSNCLPFLIFEEKWINFASEHTVTLFGCVGFSMNACGFSITQLRQFCFFTYLPRSHWSSLEKMIFFFAKIGVSRFAGPFSEAKTHWMVNWLHLLNKLDFIWSHTKVSMQNSSQLCFWNVQLLRTVNWCFSHFMPQQQYSWMWALFLAFHALVYRRGCQFLSFFHKITNI